MPVHPAGSSRKRDAFMQEYISLLRRNADYRNLWLARVVSNLGDWFNLLASAALITQLTGAGTAISYLFLARLLPVFVMSPFAGVLADRYERKAIMILSDVLRAVTVLCFLLVRRPEEIWLLYALTVLQFVLSSLYTPAHSALLSNIVRPEELVVANALDSLTWSTMLAVGALLGGIAAAAFGVTTAFILDALTFLVAAWFVSRIRASGRAAPRAADAGSGLSEIVEGMRYMRLRPFIMGLALVKAGGALAWGAINVMEIPLAQEVFPFNGNGTLTLGLIYAATGLGTGIGPLIVRRLVGDDRNGALMGILMGFGALSIGVFGLGMAPTLVWVLIASFLRSLGSGSLWVFSSAILQRTADDQYRGRVFASEFALLTLSQSISTLWAGIALDTLHLGVQGVILTTGVISAAMMLMWVWFHVRTVARPAAVTPR